MGSGKPTTVRALAELVQDTFERCTGERPELHAPDPRARAPSPTTCPSSGWESHGLRAGTPLEDALDETVRFCIEHREALR